MNEWEIGPGQNKTEDELMDVIDRGNFGGGRSGRELDIWIIIGSYLKWLVQECGLWIRSTVRKGF
jgi:hypothetical protein